VEVYEYAAGAARQDGDRDEVIYAGSANPDARSLNI
jgi:hypothetical protein